MPVWGSYNIDKNSILQYKSLFDGITRHIESEDAKRANRDVDDEPVRKVLFCEGDLPIAPTM